MVGQLRLDVTVELAVGRIRCVGEIGEAGKGGDAAHQVFQGLEFADGCPEPQVVASGGSRFKLALPFGLEGSGVRIGLCHRVAEFFRRGRRVKVAQLPGWQVAEVGGVGRSGGVCMGDHLSKQERRGVRETAGHRQSSLSGYRSDTVQACDTITFATA